MSTDSSDHSAAGAALAGALAQRVRPHLPSGLTAVADESRFVIRTADRGSGGVDIGWMLAANPRPWEELVEAVVERALNATQDTVAEASGTPWPARGGPAPTPWARVEAGVVRLGYGEPDAPMLELEPLPLPPVPTRQA